MQLQRPSRKALGAFYTPPAVSRFLAAWGIDSPDKRVLEPSCGEASFLLAAATRISELKGNKTLFDLSSESSGALVGVEIEPEASEQAQRILRESNAQAKIITGNFFDQPPTGDYDVVLGNPPFVRYQGFAGDAREKGLRAALRAGVNLNGLSSSWAPFLIHATDFLKPDGKLGMVLPAELLTVQYAAPVRSFLLKRFAHLQIVLFERLLFEGAQEDVVLLMGEGAGGCDHLEVVQVHDADALPPTGSIRVEAKSLDADKWSATLVSPEIWDTFQTVAEGPRCEAFSKWGDVYLGSVTGNNKFFCLSDEDVAEHGLTDRYLLPISPPGSKHLKELVFGLPYWKSLGHDGKCVWLFYPPDGNLSTAAERYIKHGESLGVHKGFKCRNRKPWWRVPLVDIPDLFLTYMAYDRPRLVTNSSDVHHLNSLYGVRLHQGRKQLGREALPIASLNTVTLLGAEFHGRSYGGGMLKLEPRESERIPMPSLTRLKDCRVELKQVRPLVANAVGAGNLAKAVELVDRIIWTEDHLPVRALAALTEARAMMFARRTERGKNRV